MSNGHGVIERLEIENFKSYKGHQVIGPFKSFTAIIGPNGAGKSNLMDAISFVLGVKSMQLRGSQMKDLIYALDDRDKEKSGRKAFVKLAYQPGDEQEQLQFARFITSSGASEYRINDRTVSWDQYNTQMKSIGILVKARNFLVFQGDVESVASKSPKELTNMMEQISGSEDLKREYDDLEESKKRAEEKVAFNFQKRRAMAAERKQKKEQKEEAEKHLKLLEEQAALKTEYALWQLFVIDSDMESTVKEIEEIKLKMALHRKKIEEQDQKIAGLKVEQAKVGKEVAGYEKKISKKSAEIEKRRPDVVKFKEELKRVNVQIEKAESQLAGKLEAMEKQDSDVVSLKKKLEEVESAIRDVDEEEGHGSDRLQLAASQSNEYKRIKAEAGKKTAPLHQELEALERQQKSDADAVLTLENDLLEMESREKSLREQVEQVKGRFEKSSKALEDSNADMERLKAEATEMREKHRKSRHRGESYEAKLRDIEGQLNELRAEKRESEREVRSKEVMGSLKRLFPGVHGRLSQLCKPREKRYNLAVSIVMGKMFDAVVVDDERTAKVCIEYLREQRESPMTFIPLQSARVKPVQERLRTLGGSARLLVDVIEYESVHEAALLYAVSNTLVCDGVEEAMALAWGPNRHKVVALDGTLLSKGGAMTGGVSSSMEARSTRWDDQSLEALRQERDRLVQELSGLPSQRDIQSFENSFASAMATLERKSTYADMEAKMSFQKMDDLSKEMASLLKQKEKAAPTTAQLRAAMESRGARMQKVEERIHEIEDRIFQAFSASVGVSSIREYEESRLKQQEGLAARKLQLSTRRSKIKNQLDFEASKEWKQAVAALEAKVAHLRRQAVQLSEEAAAVKEKQESGSREMKVLQQECATLRSQAEKAEFDLQSLKDEGSRLVGQAGKMKRDLGALEGQMEQLRSRRALVLETCELEQLHLQALDGDSVPMEIDSGGPVGRDMAIDYSLLSHPLKEARGADKERIDADFKSRLEAMATDLERTAPNLKALEQYEALKEKEKESVEEFDSVRKEAKEVHDRFLAVKQERYSRFVDAFEHVSTTINDIYKELTVSQTHPLGGTAYLSLENEDEPFLGGIRYTAMPPTKRFRDMEQLSGGEKTMAALALLFAIHSFRPSPFFVLDEVDAALDNLNVSRLAAYIQQKASSEKSAGFQCVVISLKDHLYDKAEGLVGVYRDSEQGCSRTLTFDLSKY